MEFKNRPLKFRAWDTKKLQWLDSIPSSEYMLDCDEWDHPDDMDSFTYLPSPITTFDDRLIIQQFTGYKDKNNKEIYEGDIVKVNEFHEAILLGEEYLKEFTAAKILWINSQFAVAQNGWIGLDEFATCDCHPCALEIIGNIFEVPKL